MSKETAQALSKQSIPSRTITLADVRTSLQKNSELSSTRRRDLISAIKRTAALFDQEPNAITLDVPVISDRLATVSAVAAGLSPKGLANLRSDFRAAIKASGMMPVPLIQQPQSLAWRALFARLSGRRAHIGLARLARYASGQGISPQDVNDRVIEAFIAAVRAGSLHRKPNALYRQVSKIWNEVALDNGLGLQQVQVPSFRGPPRRIDWNSLPKAFRTDVGRYLAWCAVSDPFAANARPRALAPTTIRLVRNQIHAAVTALVESGFKMPLVRSLSVLVCPANVKAVLRHRLAKADGQENDFNRDLGKALVQIARGWVKADAAVIAELTRLVGLMPARTVGLTEKNKRFLRQFDDPRAMRRLLRLPDKLWFEVKRDQHPGLRTLSKAQAALAIAILSYMPIRLQNLANLGFEQHLFINADPKAISSLELNAAEVKNKNAIAFDIPPSVVRMMLEYRDCIAPKLVGHRPTRLFINLDGTPKCPATVAWLIVNYAWRRAGVRLTPHQFRHLNAKIILDAQPGAFELVRQSLGHTSGKVTNNFYAGIDSRRAGRHQQSIVDRLLSQLDHPALSRRRKK